jgi:hypothetical protein
MEGKFREKHEWLILLLILFAASAQSQPCMMFILQIKVPSHNFPLSYQFLASPAMAMTASSLR